MDASQLRPTALPVSSKLASAKAVSSDLEINSQFLKTAVQELNNPITTIKTALTLLSSPSLNPKQRERYLQMIGQACDRQSNLINDVFDLLALHLTPQANVLEKIQLQDWLPGVVSTYQPIARENDIALTYTVADYLPPVLAIKAYLKQALVSILSANIARAHQDGKIWVTAHHRVDGKVALLLQDNNRGDVSSEFWQGVDSFERRQSDGSGLGLTLAKQLLIHCGASLSVSSALHAGTTYTILLTTAVKS